MAKVFLYAGWFLAPFLGVISCRHLLLIIKKAENNEETAGSAFWLTLSFVMITWIWTVTASLDVY